jgi:DNA mismatch repair protein MSH2
MSAFASFFRRLDPSAIRFFERKGEGCYYTCHGHDAVYAAEKFYKTRSVIKYLGTENLPSVSLSVKMLGEALRVILTVEKRNIELWRRDKDNSWQRDKKASPGNLQEVEGIIASGDGMVDTSAVLSAVHVEAKGTLVAVGIACLNTTWQTIGMYEFVEERDFKLLESVMLQLGTVECIVKNTKDDTSSKVQAVLRRCNIKQTDSSAASSTKDVPDKLAQLLGVEQTHAPLMEVLSNAAASAAVASLLSTLDLSSPKVAGMYKLADTKLPACMRYDAAVSAALQLFPSSNGSRDAGMDQKSCSLFTLLNECTTTAGGRLLRTWIQQPLIDASQIQRRLRVVEQLVNDAEMRQSLQEQLPKLPDIARLSLNLVRQQSSLRELLMLYKSLAVLQEILQTLAGEETRETEDTSGIRSRFLEPLQQTLTELKLFTALVEQAIDIDAALSVAASAFPQGRTVFLLPAFHPELERLRQLLDRTGEKESRLAAETARTLGVEGAQLRLERTGQHGTHFRLTNKNKNALRQKGEQYKVLSIQRAGALFTSAALKILNRQRDQIEAEYAVAQVELEAKCLAVAASYSPLFEAMGQLLTELDVLCGFAVVAISSTGAYCCPEFCEGTGCEGAVAGAVATGDTEGTEGTVDAALPSKCAGRGKLHLVQARHPCVEARSDKPYIPNDVEMCSDASRFQIITGPNMGGKSTYLRKVGCIVLMAQIGSFVPCEAATIPIVHSMMARVGASDNQHLGISTFMAEMLETAAILRLADERSLVLIDELGRGTSSSDGFGLCWAISRHLAYVLKPLCLFATHYHELVELGEQQEGGAPPPVANLHVTALTTADSLMMLHQVLPGPSDRSFGVHVAEIAQFPRAVIDEATKMANQLETGMVSNTVAAGEASRKRKRQQDGRGAVDGGEGGCAEGTEGDKKNNIRLGSELQRRLGRIGSSVCKEELPLLMASIRAQLVTAT